ncbi:MAG: short-chain dehydrogenase [Microbacteriaceae bacterium]|nr:short-chain dehydrogenase [Microbacteriaceae bacterium]
MTRTVVITGASSGVGRAAAVALAATGAELAVVGRNAERTAAVAEETGGTAFVADFGELDQVRDLAAALLERYPTIDVLANNAGGLVQTRRVTADGFELTLQANYLAPVLLTRLLLPRMAESAGTMIATSSNSNTSGHVDLDDLGREHASWLGGWPQYAATKLETNLFVHELARRHPEITAYAFHPGYVASGFGDEVAIMRFAQWISRRHLGLSNEQGAAPLVALATGELSAPSGTYFARMKPNGRENPAAHDLVLAATLWTTTEDLLGLS